MQEARSLLKARLPLPAYGCLLHMSHVFNVLDARGVVGLSERNRVFVAMRNVARDVSSRAMTSVGWERMRGCLAANDAAALALPLVFCFLRFLLQTN